MQIVIDIPEEVGERTANDKCRFDYIGTAIF